MRSVMLLWQTLGFGVRLTTIMVALILSSIIALTSLVFLEYKKAQTDMVLNTLQTSGELNTAAFTDWLQVRQDEMRYLANIAAVEGRELALSAELMQQLAQMQGYWDTIFIVSPQGKGLVGVSFNQGQARILSAQEAADFDVADRDWFRQAISGQHTFSQPVISRATGNNVSTVAIPITQNNRIVGVMRGAVQLNTIFNKVNALTHNSYTEIYLLDREGRAITPATSVQDQKQPLQTEAAIAARQQRSDVGLYQNAANEDVIGSYHYIPVLGWSLVLESQRDAALAQVTSMLWTLIVISAVVVLVAVAVCISLVRSITKTLGGEPDYAARIVHQVSRGDLTAVIQLRQSDKNSLLASINTMQQNLRQMMRQIGSYSEQVATAATELSQINEQTRDGIVQQSQEISHSAVAMSQMTTSLEDVSRSTQQAASAVGDANAETRQGQQIVAETVNELQRLSTEVGKAAEIITHLKSDSDQIGNILQVIESIAEQTNLLALNAAIEAARAGDSGRGFAVVADEVRTLASRTKDSTTEIQQMIEKLQAGTEQAVRATANSEQAAQATMQVAGKAGLALVGISKAVMLINDTAQQIASATEQQTLVSRDINQNLHRISDVAYQTTDNVNQSAQASESLADLAEQLKEIVKRFKV